jgi:hypothetical protein
LLPEGLLSHNVATQNDAARNGNWRARIDTDGGVWMWIETTEATGSEDDEETTGGSNQSKVNGLPPIITLALGGGHVVALTQDGEVWTWEIAPGLYPDATAPPGQPAKLPGLPEITGIGTWHEYGFARSGDGAIWIWQGVENKYAALSDEELAAAIGILTGNTATQNNPKTSPASKAAPLLRAAAMMQATAASAPAAPPANGLRLWLKADTGVVADNAGIISQWQDQSGKNNHASQSAAGARPQVVASVTAGGLPAVRFDGVGTHMSFSNLYTVPSGSPSAELFIVLRSRGGTAGRYAFALSHHGGLKYPASEGMLSDDFGRLVTPVSLALPNGTDLQDWHIYNATNGGVAKDWIGRLDGTVIGRADGHSLYWYPWSYLGKSAAYSNSFWSGDIAEIIAYDRALATEEREEVEHYLRSRHGFGLPPAPATPAAPAVDILDATRALVGWEVPSQPATCELQRRMLSGAGGSWEDIAVDGRQSLLDEGLASGATYAYRLRTRNVSGASTWSTETTVTMPGTGTQGMPFDGLRLWLHPAGTDAGTGGTVQTWSDWSGRKAHATAANAAARPQLIGNALGGRSVVRFDGVANQLGFPTSMFNGAREMEQYIVLKAKSGAPAGRQAYALGHTSSTVQYPATDGTIRDNLGKSSGAETIQFPAGSDAYGWHLYHTRVTAQSRLARVDGRLAYQSAGLDSIYNYPWSYLGKVGSNAWAGDIAEIIIYDRALAVGEHAAVQNYLAGKYNLPPLTAPEPVSTPAGISASVTAAGTITVTWDAVPGAGASYELQVLIPGREYRTLAVLPPGTASHAHSDLNPDATYTYRIRTRAPLGVSAWSDEASATTPALPPPADGQPPSTGLRLWLHAGTGITLDDQGMVAHWADQSGRNNHAGYMPGEDYWMWSGLTPAEDPQLGAVVQADGWADGLPLPALMDEATGGELFVVIKTSDSYDDITPLTLGHTFYYPRWRDYYYDPESPQPGTDIIADSFGRSVAVDMAVPEDKPIRNHWRLYNVSASADGWAARLDGALIGEVEGGPLVFGQYGAIGGGMGGPAQIAEILVYHRALSGTERAALAAYLGQKYQLDVALPPELQPPAPPENFSATATGQTAIALAWTASPTEGAAYELERKSGDSGFAPVATLPAGTVSCSDTGLNPATTYTYRLRAVKDGRFSAYTAGVAATTDDPHPVTSNLRLWLKADAGVVTDAAGKISQWQDMSGKNNHAGQSTAGARPQVVASVTAGGLPAVRFDGVGTHMSFSNLYTVPSGSPSAEFFIVLRSQESTAGRYAFALSHHGGLKYPASEGMLSDDFGRLVTPVSLALPNGTDLQDWHIYNATNGGAAKDWIGRLDGAVIGRADGHSLYWYPWSYLGKSAAYSNSFWAGDIAEIIVYDRALSTGEREDVERYLRWRHGFGQPVAPATPAAPGVDIINATQVMVEWRVSPQPATGELQRREYPEGAWEDIPVEGKKSLLDGGLIPGASYEYRLRARNAGGTSAWSAGTVVTMPGAGTAGMPMDGLRLWLHPGGADGNDGSIQTWNDWSGRKNHATAPNATARPALVENMLGGRSTVRFDGVANQLGFPTSMFNGAREMEQYIVLKAKSGAPAGRQAYALGHTSSTVQYPATDGTIRDNLGKLSGAETIQFPAGSDAYGWHLYHTRVTAQSRLARVDGQLAHQSAGLDSIYNYPWSYLGKVGSNAWAGDIAEIIVYDRALAVGEHVAVQNYLAEKYGLSDFVAPEAIGVPQGVTATLASSNEVTLTWSAVEAGASYEVQTRTPGRDYYMVVTVKGGVTQFEHGDLNPEVAYTYRVRTRTALGISEWSDEVAAVTPALSPPANGQPPATGMRLWLRADMGVTLDDQGMVAHWADQSGRGNHAGYMPGEDYWMWSGLMSATDPQLGAVIRGDYGDGLPLPSLLNEATGGEIHLVIKSASGYEDITPFSLGHTFYYPRWRDYYYDPENPNSDIDIIGDSFGRPDTVDMAVPGQRPIDGHWRLYSVSASVNGWSARLDNEVLASLEGGPLVFGQNGYIGGMMGMFEIAEIIVYNRALSDAERNTVSAYLAQKHGLDVVLPPDMQPPEAPSNMVAMATGSSSIELTWTASPTDGASYELERKTGEEAFAKVADIAANITTFTDNGLSPATTYTYRLRAVRTGFFSGYTAGASATTDPLQPVTNNLRLWLKADAGVVADGAGVISQWQDQSGRNNHASQSTAGARPQVVASVTAGGLPAVRFDGVGTHMSFSNLYTVPSGSPSAEFFIVLRSQGSTTGRYAFALSHHGGVKYPASEGMLSDDFGRLVTPVSLALPNGTNLQDWHIYNATNGGAARDWIGRLDGAVIGRADGHNLYWYPWSYLGKSAAYSNSFWAGDIAEIIVYDRALSTGEREDVERYLRWRHGFGQPVVPATLAAPGVDIINATQAMVEWRVSPQPATGELQRREYPEGAWEDIPVDGKKSLLDGGLIPGASYGYRLRARNAGGTSAWSDETVVTMPGAGTAGMPMDGLRLWLHPGGTDGNGGNIQTWSDWSGRKNHATASNATARPALVENTLGGRSVVRFDGVSNQLGFPTSAFNGAREMEQYIVLKAKSGAPAGRQAYALGHTSSTVQYPATDGTIRDNLGKSSGAETIQFPAGSDAYGWHLYHTRVTAQSRLARVDGQLAHQSAGLDSIYTYPWSYLGKVNSNAWAGDIAEVLVYERALTVREHTAVQDYLAGKYGLPDFAAPEAVSTPQGVAAALASNNEVTLTWPAVEAGAAYEVQVMTPGRDYYTVATVKGGVTQFEHGDLNPEVAYAYRVRTRTALGISEWSDAVTVVTPALPPPADGQPPATGMRLWLRADMGVTLDDQGMVAHWADQSGRGNHAGYMPGEDYWMWSGLAPATDPQLGAVIRGDYGDGLPLPSLLNEATGGEIHLVIKSASGYEDISPFSLGHTFYYPRWRDYYYDPENPNTNIDIIGDSFGRPDTVDMAVPEQRPINGHWRLYSVSASVSGWSARLDNEVLASLEGGPLVFGQNGHIGGMMGMFEIAEIIVYNRALSDAERNTVSAYLAQKYGLDVVLPPDMQPPEAPSNLVATATGSSSIELTWTASPTDGAFYEIERRLATRTDDSFVRIATISPGITLYADEGLEAQTAYVYQIRSILDGRVSEYANNAEATTQPEPVMPAIRIVTPVSGGTIAWNAGTTVTAEVDPGDSEIVRVEFYRNGMMFGVANEAPYSLELSNIQPGEWILSAKAVAEDGISAWSETIVIIISEKGAGDHDLALSPSYGAIIADVAASGKTVLVPALRRQAVWQGRVTAVSGASLQLDLGSSGGIPLPADRPVHVEVVGTLAGDPAQTGRVFDVTAIDGNNVTCHDSVAGRIRAGDIVALRAHTVLADVFAQTTASPGDDDIITFNPVRSLPEGSHPQAMGAPEDFRYVAEANGPGNWGRLPDDSQDASLTVIYPDRAIIVNRQNNPPDGSLLFAYAGTVRTWEAFSQPMIRGVPQYIGSGNLMGIRLADYKWHTGSSGTGLIGAANAGEADTLTVGIDDFSRHYWYRTDADPPGWRLLGDAQTDRGDDAMAPGSLLEITSPAGESSPDETGIFEVALPRGN